MNFRKGKASSDDIEINLIPFIDVLLVILIFLMVTTTYSRFSELKVSLPTASADSAPNRPLVLSVMVDQTGNVSINNQAVQAASPSQLANELKRQVPSQTDEKGPVVVVYADAQAKHQSVVNVLEAARIAGLGRITFATVKPK